MNKREQERKAKNERRRALDAAGLCVECGEQPRTLNRDGSKSVRCVSCKQRADLGKPRSGGTTRSSAASRPTALSEWEVEENFGYLDTPAFHNYTKTVMATIRRLTPRNAAGKVVGRVGATIGEQRRAMGGKFVERMHADALEYLMAARDIDERQCGAMTRYLVADTRPVKLIDWNGTPIAGPKVTPRPDASVYEDPKRRPTA